MRTLAAMLLAVVALFAGLVVARADDAPAKRPEWPDTVRGEGRTAEAATNAALAEAQHEVSLYLVANYPDIQWRPTAEYLRRRLAIRIQGPDRTGDKTSDF